MRSCRFAPLFFCSVLLLPLLSSPGFAWASDRLPGGGPRIIQNPDPVEIPKFGGGLGSGGTRFIENPELSGSQKLDLTKPGSAGFGGGSDDACRRSRGSSALHTSLSTPTTSGRINISNPPVLNGAEPCDEERVQQCYDLLSESLMSSKQADYLSTSTGASSVHSAQARWDETKENVFGVQVAQDPMAAASPGSHDPNNGHKTVGSEKKRWTMIAEMVIAYDAALGDGDTAAANLILGQLSALNASAATALSCLGAAHAEELQRKGAVPGVYKSDKGPTPILGAKYPKNGIDPSRGVVMVVAVPAVAAALESAAVAATGAAVLAFVGVRVAEIARGKDPGEINPSEYAPDHGHGGGSGGGGGGSSGGSNGGGNGGNGGSGGNGPGLGQRLLEGVAGGAILEAGKAGWEAAVTWYKSTTEPEKKKDGSTPPNDHYAQDVCERELALQNLSRLIKVSPDPVAGADDQIILPPTDSRVTVRQPQTEAERAGVQFNIADPNWVTKDLSQTCKTIRTTSP